MPNNPPGNGWFQPWMTDEELEEKLGVNYVAPKDLYKKTKEMPFLGKVTCETKELTCGEWTEIILDYDNSHLWMYKLESKLDQSYLQLNL